MPTRKHQFEVTLQGGEKGQLGGWIEVPLDVEELYGTRGRVPLKVTLNGFTYRSSMSPMGMGCHVIPVRQERLDKAKVRPGQKVKVTIEKDVAARVVRAPADLAAALTGSAKASAKWKASSYTHRKEYADWIRGAKQEETRARRVKKAIELLASGKPRA